MIRACALLVLAGCNDLLRLGDPTLATDAGIPSCQSGWRHQIPVEITNDSGAELHDYQVVLDLDPAIVGDDLRFVTDAPLAYVVEAGRAWVAVPVIPIGTSSLTMFHGNPFAGPSQLGSPFTPDIITNPSFEALGGWTIEPAIGPPAAFNLQSSAWVSDGTGSLGIDEEVSGERASTSVSRISQLAVFPVGSDYVIRFDIDVVAASNGGINGTNNGSFLFTLGNGLTGLWTLSGDHGNITGAHLDEETAAFGPGSMPLSFEVRVAAGSGPGYAKGFLDHLRVRKHVSPEPTVRIGTDEGCR